VRIEMRQIGMREEASRIGDIGPCGSYVCCHTWSTNFKTDTPFVTSYKKKSRWEGNKFECYIKDETLNKNGDKLDNLKDEAKNNNKDLVTKVLFYENVVGQDSITRFDNKDSKRKNNHKNKKRKPQK
jgi:hypothetical protein